MTDARSRTTREIDIVALGEPRAGRRPVLALGEARWGEQMGVPHLERLRRVREVVASRRDVEAADAVLLCASGAGFHDDLLRLADVGEVELVDLHRLYYGD